MKCIHNLQKYQEGPWIVYFFESIDSDLNKCRNCKTITKGQMLINSIYETHEKDYVYSICLFCWYLQIFLWRIGFEIIRNPCKEINI